MQKIYYKNKPVFLTDSLTDKLELNLQSEAIVFASEINDAAIAGFLLRMEKDGVTAGIIHYANIQTLKKAFASHFTVIAASGGLVIFEQKVLLIFRRGKWDLPKGKLDEGETLEACAAREIEEETGVGNLTLISPLTITYHTYEEGELPILKESYWYLFRANEEANLVPQTGEDIELCQWMSIKDLKTYQSNMHASIVDVIREGLKMLM